MNELAEYLSWLLRETYRESNVKWNTVSCESFKLVLNRDYFDDYILPDKLLGWDVDVISNVYTTKPIILTTSLDDSYDKNIIKWLKCFYELQELYDFYYSTTWKERE